MKTGGEGSAELKGVKGGRDISVQRRKTRKERRRKVVFDKAERSQSRSTSCAGGIQTKE